MTKTSEDLPFLIEYFSGIKNGDFYEEPVQGDYPDWQIQSLVKTISREESDKIDDFQKSMINLAYLLLQRQKWSSSKKASSLSNLASTDE